MAARMPVLRQHDMGELRRQAIDHRHDLVASRHRQAAAGTEVVLDIDDQEYIALADAECFRSWSCAFVSCQAAVDLGGQPHQRVRDFNRACCSRFETAQGFGQAFEIARGLRADFG